MKSKNGVHVKGLKSRVKWMRNVYRFGFDYGIKRYKWGICNMSKLEFNELKFEKETQNFARYRFERVSGDSEEVRGTVYLPKKARNAKVVLEYEVESN